MTANGRQRGALLLVLAVALCAGAGGLRGSGSAEAVEYVCPHGHDEVDQKTKRCEVCGMKLTRQSEILNVAILVFDGVQIIDYTGPYEVFAQVPFHTFTVSRTGEPIETTFGMSMMPSHSFETAPRPDILVVPGGSVDGQFSDEKVVEWVRGTAAQADHVLSVCNGAFILAKAGLLDGQKATTFYGLIDQLRSFAPQTTVVDDQRFVDNGKVITTAGLSSGIDGSLHLVSKIKGEVAAKRLALHLEYDWRPESDFARAALADRRLPQIEPPAGVDVYWVATDGDRDHWRATWKLENAPSREWLLEYIEGQLGRLERWSKLTSTESRTTWQFVDERGRPWSGVTVVESGQGDGELLVTTEVARRPTEAGKDDREAASAISR